MTQRTAQLSLPHSKTPRTETAEQQSADLRSQVRLSSAKNFQLVSAAADAPQQQTPSQAQPQPGDAAVSVSLQEKETTKCSP